MMDFFHAHCTGNIQDLLAAANSEATFIPGGCTSKLQPLDCISLALDGPENNLFRNDTCLKLPTADIQAEEESED